MTDREEDNGRMVPQIEVLTDTSQGMSVVLKVVRGQEQILLEPLEKHSPSDLHLSMAKLNLDLCPIAYCCFESPNFGSLFQQPQESNIII